ncbi:MAG: DUF2953 domain-containing protein [Clostridia bacterium]|nr:DUF2953 domain-containing protein [Clostridia bacterium]
MPFLYTLLAIIAFIIVLFLIPVRVTGHYENTFEMYIKYGFIKIKLFPQKEKNKKDKPKKEKAKKDKPSKETSEKSESENTDKSKSKKKKDITNKENIFLKFYRTQGFDATLQLIADALSAVGGIFGGIFKHFVFRELYLEMVIAGSDAAETAIKYGKISSAVFPAMGLLCSKAKVRKYDIDISPDFLAVKDEAMFHFQFGFCPIFATNAVIVAGFKLFKNVLLELIKVNNSDNKDKKHLEKQVKKALKKER